MGEGTSTVLGEALQRPSSLIARSPSMTAARHEQTSPSASKGLVKGKDGHRFHALDAQPTMWIGRNRACPVTVKLADRHYNRQKVGSPQFVPPGRCLVLYTGEYDAQAMWVTSWPLAQYVYHRWAGAWINSAFRNEGAGLSSLLIRKAIAATRAVFAVPEIGMITFIDQAKVRPIRVRGVETWGYSYKKAGFREVGRTKERRLLALQILPEDMPDAEAAL